jgi:hypothetical protein
VTFKIEVGSLQQQADFRSLELPFLDALEILLDHVGASVVEYLRSYTNEWRPPERGGTTRRRAHPGHWADITHDLEAGYHYKIERNAEGVTLALLNDSGHAIYVEAMDGFYVLKGVTDKGGPVEQAIRTMILRYIPGAQVY